MNGLRDFALNDTPVDGLEIFIRALALAIQLHAGQFRKDGKPFHTHLFWVVRLLVKAGIVDTKILAADALHDALEESQTPEIDRARILDEFGQEVTRIVDALTDAALNAPQPVRKAIQLAHIKKCSKDIQLIKFADVVASMEEGPAPGWSRDKIRTYVVQQTDLVQAVAGTSPELCDLFAKAVGQPVWQDALRATESHP